MLFPQKRPPGLPRGNLRKTQQVVAARRRRRRSLPPPTGSRRSQKGSQRWRRSTVETKPTQRTRRRKRNLTRVSVTTWVGWALGQHRRERSRHALSGVMAAGSGTARTRPGATLPGRPRGSKAWPTPRRAHSEWLQPRARSASGFSGLCSNGASPQR